MISLNIFNTFFCLCTALNVDCLSIVDFSNKLRRKIVQIYQQHFFEKLRVKHLPNLLEPQKFNKNGYSWF